MKKTFYVVFMAITLLLSNNTYSEQLTFFAEDFTHLGGPGFVRGMYDLDTITGSISLRTTVDTGCRINSKYCSGENGARFFSMDKRPSDGVVFATEPFHNDLFTVNIDTGKVVLIGSTLPDMVAANDWQIISIAFDPTTNKLYGLGRGRFVEIDTTNGKSTILGELNNVQRGLAFLSSGELYGYRRNNVGGNITTELYSIDLSSLSERFVGSTPTSQYSGDATITDNGRLYISDFSGKVFHTGTVSGNTSLIISGEETGLENGGMLALISTSTTLPNSLVMNESLGNSNKLFNWAEQTYPEYFRPIGLDTFETEGYLVRFYPETKNYLGTKNGRVYVLDSVIKGLQDVGDINYFLNIIEPNNTINLTGNWKGESKVTSYSTDPGCPLQIEVSLTQKGNELTGTGYIYGKCSLGPRVTITGILDGNNIYTSFSLYGGDNIIYFDGLISEDSKSLSGDYFWPNKDYNQGIWSLSLQ